MQETPHSTQKAAPEPPLRREECAGKKALKKADAAPAGTQDSTDVQCHAQDTLGELVNSFNGLFDEHLVSGEGKEAEEYGEQFCEHGHGVEKERYVGAHA